ncbi:hydroxyacid dehydrogenase [Horticoccus luteus]|uniref:Hydroxyacid dehydrogenase n=1 Tax=Horticoccus luteus TaxID=2862869 RepID=A0A8F9TZE5_9BACT|nr:hydroxyacid dehydrogenase [Horticoccus luteus]QYM80689.1 hydroxyacid dehydrogenase [Horticoccus luteus]
MTAPFNLKLTADFFDAAGRGKYADIGLSVLAEAPHITTSAFAEHRPEIAPEQLAGANGVIVLTPKVTAQSVAQAGDLIAVGRFGVGYDSVDVAACTAADVAVFITTGAVDRPVAEATVGWMIALTHHMRVKDRLARTGEWDARSRFMGAELRDRTLGVIGLGGIARTVIKLLAGWGMKPPLAFDPFMTPEAAAQAGARLVSLDELMREADFVSVHCPLSPQTRGLIGAEQIGLMKSTAYLLNTARGGIVDEAALRDALEAGRIAGAALDCFATEPVAAGHPFANLDNVLLAPHSIAWTNELFRDIGRTACQGMIDLSLGRQPRGVVNPAVFEKPSFQAKWRRVRGD